MPEGPEVESVRLELIQLNSKKVEKIHLTPLSQKYPKYVGKQILFDQFSEKTILNIIRFGKFLIWQFGEVKAVILNHLGMSGKWHFIENITEVPSTVSHVKIIIEMENPPSVIFDDTRNFGQFKIFSSLEKVKQYNPIKSLGIDGLITPFPIEEFLKRFNRKNYEDKPVGEVLLNQRLVAGIGNIYKSESLFQAKINPLRKVITLSNNEKETLGIAISEVLQKALNDGGSTFQAYELPSGTSGNAQLWHRVYNRKDEPCNYCGSKIVRIVQKDRSTFFCPECQK